jgi:NAD(P)-dependent dehydrogenase (short-subunit alcohol dehydrogenase family)
LADRDSIELERIAKEVPGSQTIVFDQGEKVSIENMCLEAQNPDILLNNAGILWAGPFDEMPSDEITTIVNVNLLGPMQIAHNIGKQMLRRGSGIIINTSSQLAFHGAAERAVYASTKAGIAQFTKSLAAEWMPRGVRVAAIAPGRTLTNINVSLLNSEEKQRTALKGIPAGRLAEAHEMARLALLLSTDVLSYVVGETIISDGGYVLL